MENILDLEKEESKQKNYPFKHGQIRAKEITGKRNLYLVGAVDENLTLWGAKKKKEMATL